MADESGIAVSNYQMSLTLLDVQTWCKQGRAIARCIDDYATGKFAPVRQSNTTIPNLGHWTAKLNDCATRLCSFNQKPRRAGRIQYCILGDEQPSGQAFPQIRLGRFQCTLIENLNRHATLTVVSVLAADLRHFFFISRHPDRSGRSEFHILREFATQFLPQELRVTSQR